MGAEMMVQLDDIKIEALNLCLSERPPIPTPERQVEHIEIKGRNGSLTKKYGFRDIQYPLQFEFLEDDTSFKQAFRLAKIPILQAKKLCFLDDPTVYYKVKSVQIDEAVNDIFEYGQFTANFTLDPFAYENDTTTKTLTSQQIIINPGYESEPYIKATVSGTGRIYVNNQVVTIKDINGIIEMDSAMMNAYRKENGYITNLNNHMTGDFLLFEHGNNLVKFDGGISKLEIEPRWRWV